MAIKDVRKYYYTMLNQYIESKNDLTDFEQAVKDGYITEDRLQEVREEIEAIKNNVDRISYVMYLLELPNRSEKKKKFKKANQELQAAFEATNADDESVKQENNSLIKSIKENLINLTK